MPRKVTTHRRGAEKLRAIGRRIRKAREEMGFTQGGLAKALGMAVFSVARYERGEIACTVLVLLDICRVLGKTPDEVLV